MFTMMCDASAIRWRVIGDLFPCQLKLYIHIYKYIYIYILVGPGLLFVLGGGSLRSQGGLGSAALRALRLPFIARKELAELALRGF